MCILCDQGKPQNHSRSQLGRRDFLKASTLAAAGGAAMGLFAAAPVRAEDAAPPPDSGRPGRRYIIRGGHVMSMDKNVGDFVEADVLVDGKRIRGVGRSLRADGAAEIDARGKIVMPGFIDTHHHLFETALRSFLANGILNADNTSEGKINYFQYILLKFAPVYRPWDVYVSELFGSLSALDAGVTTVHDISQIHHSPEHSDAAIKALQDSDRRAVFGYFESAGGVAGNQYPQDARRIRKQYFSSDNQLLSMIMGGEIYLPGYEAAWRIGRDLKLPIAAHIVGAFFMRQTFDNLASGVGGDSGTLGIGPDNLFIHVTEMSPDVWPKLAAAGVDVSLAVPIEMNMRHGMPPILQAIANGIQPSLSTDVEVTLTADMFTQMRSTMTLQRAIVNQMVFDDAPGNPWPQGPFPNRPALLRTQDVLRFATMEGAEDLRLDRKVGSLTPGKEADIIILDAQAINVAPLNNVPGAVVSLMERSNVETVISAGKVRKWKGKLLDVDLPKLRGDLEKSREYLMGAAGISAAERHLFRPD